MRGRLQRRRTAVALVVLALLGLAGALTSLAASRSGVEVDPRPVADVVRGYAAGVAARDARRVCRLSSLHALDQAGCVSARRAFLRRVPAGTKVGLAGIDVRRDAASGLARASVRLSLRPRRGGARPLRDVWWLERRRGDWRVVRAGAFDATIARHEVTDRATARPVTESEATRPAKLRPALACTLTRGTALQSSSVEASGASPSATRADWLDLVRVEAGATPDGAACLRLVTAEPVRPATTIGITVEQADTSTAAPIGVDATAAIAGDGQVVLDRVSDPTVRVGASDGSVTFVLPARFAVQQPFGVAVESASSQALEPLIARPLLAGDLVEQVEIR